MRPHIIGPFILSMAYLVPMTAFGAWLGLGWGQTLGLAFGGLAALLAILMAIAGLVQLIGAKEGDRRKAGA